MPKQHVPKPKELLSLTHDERRLVAEQIAKLLADELLNHSDGLSVEERAFLHESLRGVRPESLSPREREGFHTLIKRVAPPQKRRRS